MYVALWKWNLDAIFTQRLEDRLMHLMDQRQ